MNKEDLAVEFVLSIERMHSNLQKKIEGQLNFHGISFTEYLIMYHLSAQTNKTMRRIQLAQSVGITASGVTRLLAPMEKIKLITKESNPRDARVSLVKLSKVGEKVFKEAQISFNHSAVNFLELLSEKQVIALTEKIQKLT
ncbi:MAG: transcriptional regulator [SAR86 cluster bacterium]|uniref:Transcriptional regulator n=1 Tax=SAR86 cluster bacterium TaxID=2030880 RepID=A0A2A4MHU7_9GAMM|nr:MAG: transcriptional regulator [SAR86 cluster bacterium]